MRLVDDIDRRLLSTIQTDFPLCSHPYAQLGERLGISENEALGRVQALAASGVIRRVGPAFDSASLGHCSTLVAAKVPSTRLEEVACIISSYKEVTHNYGRDFEHNLWFTLVCADQSLLKSTLERIKSETGIQDMHALPAEHVYKIRVEFSF